MAARDPLPGPRRAHRRQDARRRRDRRRHLRAHRAGDRRRRAGYGGYEPVGELDLFDVEYWSLEQAKLEGAAPDGAARAAQVALVTGAASGIGLAHGAGAARRGRARGRSPIATGRAGDAPPRSSRRSGPGASRHAACDVTSSSDVAGAPSAPPHALRRARHRGLQRRDGALAGRSTRPRATARSAARSR